MINVFRTDLVETLTKGCFSRYVYAPALEQVALRPTGFYDVARSNLLRFIRTLLSKSYTTLPAKSPRTTYRFPVC
jgi:hypothetical protein